MLRFGEKVLKKNKKNPGENMTHILIHGKPGGWPPPPPPMEAPTPGEQIRQAKRRIEQSLLHAISNDIEHACADFTEETGLSINGCRIEFVDVTALGSERKQYVIGGVTIYHEQP
jgi:hypothetical protein